MFIWCKHSSAQVMTNTRPDKNATNKLRLHTAKNMTVCGQVCLREHKDFKFQGANFSALPAEISAEYHLAEPVCFNDGVPYPDILSSKRETEVKAHYTQTVWVTFRISEKAATGNYPIVLQLLTDLGEFRAEFELTVYSTVLPEPKNGGFGHEYFFDPTTQFAYKDTPAIVPDKNPFWQQRYSDEWWQLMQKYAITMKDLRINSLYLPTLALLKDAGTKQISSTKWEFRFELLDKFVETFLQYGSFNRITVRAIVQSADGTAIEGIDKNGKSKPLQIPESAAESWAKAYYSALYRHFEEKGWLPLLYMHLQDEPHKKEYWQWARDLCKRYMPSVPCCEPLDTHAVAEELNALDVYIPRIDIYESHVKFYKTQQKRGDELWVYSCCYPEDNWWLNKFIDLPWVYSRQMSWVCFSQGITGFLHWGFNYWFSDLYGVNPSSRFKGDGAIVYPNAKADGLDFSARAVNTRDGIQEYELLHLLSLTAPQKAKSLAKRVGKSFLCFNDDENCVDVAQKVLLELLEKH